MAGLLHDKVTIVTGGASGIGLASVRRFADEGAKVVIADIAEEDGLRAVDELGDVALFHHTDVTDEGSIQGAIDLAVQRFGRLDIMFNNAGTVGTAMSVFEIEAAELEKMLAVDVQSVVLGHKLAARQFRAQGTAGSIVTTASVASLEGGWSSLAYTTAKHAIVGTIRHAAKELAPYGIRTNAVAPGVIMTPLVGRSRGLDATRSRELLDHLTERLGPDEAMGRYGTAEDIAAAALFFASDLSAYVSGTVLPVDGGISSYTLSTSDVRVAAEVETFLGVG